MAFRILRPDSTSVWKNEEILKRFAYYRAILDGKKPARYLIAKTLDCSFNYDDELEDLTQELIQKSIEFKEILKEDTKIIKEPESKEKSYIKLAETIARKYLEKCVFCERQCEVNRISGDRGYCLIDEHSYVSSTFLHHGEESVLIPSGTIFFQGCNFGCVFCQNYDISQAWKGQRELEDIARKVNAQQLANLAENLEKKGALNINYVGGDPIPNIHTIVGSLNNQTSNTCQLWNSNFYLTEMSLALIIDFMDFWLPDFKYGNNECAQKYSKVENYYDILTRNLKRVHDDGSGEIIIRHLVMPNHVECCSKPILDFVAREVPKCVVNIMGQYRPQYKAYNYEEINRRPSSNEMAEVKDYADQLGILYKPVS